MMYFNGERKMENLADYCACVRMRATSIKWSYGGMENGESNHKASRISYVHRSPHLARAQSQIDA